MNIRFANVVAALSFLLVACGGNTAEAKSPSGADGTASSSSTSSASEPSGGTASRNGDNDLSELETKRLTDNIKADIPKHKATFKDKCGFDVAIDVDWASFGRDKKALETLWSNWGIEGLVGVVTKVCDDKTGKDAVKAKIKTLRAVNVKDSKQVKFSLAGGTLTLALAYGASSDIYGKDKNGSTQNSDDATAFVTKSL
jgi:hypothetical protein